jgi:hypothetical protein
MTTTRVLFIDEAYFKKMTGLSDDENQTTSPLDAGLLISAIEDSQILYLEDLLGSGVCNELKSQINSGTITGYNATLLYDYVKPAHVKYTMALLPYNTTYQLTNKGYQSFTSDTSKPAEDKTLDKLENRYMEVAQKWGNKIVKYLQENHLHFPLYDNPGSGLDVVRPKSSSLLSSIYLPINQTWTGCRTSNDAENNYGSLDDYLNS